MIACAVPVVAAAVEVEGPVPLIAALDDLHPLGGEPFGDGARPMPPAPPVTTATRPAKLPIAVPIAGFPVRGGYQASS
jgi:hypothetical protein